MEAAIWQNYQSLGVRVWGVVSRDERDVAIRFVDQMGLTFPILFDEGSTVLDQYGRLPHGFGTAYPQDYIVGIDGTIAYANPGYEPDEVTAIIDEELAKVGGGE